MKIERHTINGVFEGAWYTLDDGRTMYLAHRRKRDLVKDGSRLAWGIDPSVIMRAEREGVQYIGVVTMVAKKRQFFVTTLADFLDPIISFDYRKKKYYRCLPLKWFKINPDTDPGKLDRRATIRR